MARFAQFISDEFQLDAAFIQDAANGRLEFRPLAAEHLQGLVLFVSSS
jgi:hypothetical protein